MKTRTIGEKRLAKLDAEMKHVHKHGTLDQLVAFGRKLDRAAGKVNCYYCAKKIDKAKAFKMPGGHMACSKCAATA